MVGGHFGGQQGVTADFAERVERADLGLFRIRQAGPHRAGRHEDDWQVGETERADHQARHDLVADAQHQAGIEGVVAERHGGAHGDDIAREQAEFHARTALRHAITHGGHAAGDLGGGAELARHTAELFRIVMIGLVGRQHVVIGGHDADIGYGVERGLQLFIGRRGGDDVGIVGAAKLLAARFVCPVAIGAFHELLAQILGALDDACGHFGDYGMQCGHDILVLSPPKRIRRRSDIAR